MNETKLTLWRRLLSFIAAVANFKRERPWVRRFVLALPDWVTPDRVTYFRGLVPGPAVWLMLCWHYYWLAIFHFTVSMALDALDGWVAAHKPLLKTERGVWLDPLFDKIVICGTFSTLLLAGLVPWWFCFLIGPIVLLAAFNTLVRAAKLWLKKWLRLLFRLALVVDEERPPVVIGDPSTGPIQDASLAAGNFGKFKLINETVAGLWMLFGLALGSTAVLYAGFAFLLPALLFAFGSAKDQVRSLFRP